MKVLHITSSLDSGGIARLLLDYCTRMMPEISFDFAITSSQKGMLEDELTSLGCNVYHIPQVRKGIVKHCRALEKIMRDGKYDIVHDHSDYRSLFSLIVAKRVGVKERIAHSHLAFVPETKLKRITRKILTRYVIRLSTRLMACGEDAAKWMWGEKLFLSGKVTVMTNAISTDKFLFDEEKRKKLRRDLGIGNEFVIGNVARFTYQKNHEFLLDIFSEIIRSKPNSRLLLVGDGELKEQIVTKAKMLKIYDKIIFLGNTNKVFDYLNVMDVFVLPSRFEGLGIVYVEAQTNGLHCFASKDVVPREVNICEAIEYISLNNSSKEWAARINHCNTERLVNPELSVIKSGYEINSAVSKIKDFYFSLVHEV